MPRPGTSPRSRSPECEPSAPRKPAPPERRLARFLLLTSPGVFAHRGFHAARQELHVVCSFVLLPRRELRGRVRGHEPCPCLRGSRSEPRAAAARRLADPGG